MAGKAGALSEKPTTLPAKYERLFPWELDRRCTEVREIAADLHDLWESLGGVENLSVQKRWLCERLVFMRRQMRAHEEADWFNQFVRKPDEQLRPVPLTEGEYSNFANVSAGHLKALGLERGARTIGGLQGRLRQKRQPVTLDNESPHQGGSSVP